MHSLQLSFQNVAAAYLVSAWLVLGNVFAGLVCPLPDQGSQLFEPFFPQVSMGD